MAIHFINGRLVNEEQLLLSPRDVGYSRGFAVFDFLRTYLHHRPFKLQEHIDRLFNSAQIINLKIPWNKDQIKEWINQTLDANQTEEEKFIKIIISGGISNTMLPSSKPTVIILVDPVTQYPKEQYKKGVGVISVKFERYMPEAKSNNYIEGVKQTQIAQKIEAVEPIYYNDEQVFEGSNSNIFAVIGGELLTPADHILEGITRAVLLEILELNISLKVQNFTIDQLVKAQEIFLTASGKEIVPVTTIDGQAVGSGQVGPITKQTMKQFHVFTSSNLW